MKEDGTIHDIWTLSNTAETCIDKLSLGRYLLKSHLTKQLDKEALRSFSTSRTKTVSRSKEELPLLNVTNVVANCSLRL